MTPWQFNRAVDGFSKRTESEHDSKAWIMWHGAMLQRCQKLPPLQDFLSSKKPVKGIDEHAIMARLKAYQKRRENVGN